MGLKFIDPDATIQKRIEWFIINSSPDNNELRAQSQIRKLNVVIVDDDHFQSDVASSAFLARGDRVRVASDGLAGLALCIEDKPDVVLTDVQMPRMDGWQMVRLIRARSALAKVPILFLTSLSSEQDRLVGYRLGVDDYLTKPHNPQDLLTRVDRAVLRAEQLNRSMVPAERDALRGDLRQVSIQSVLGFLEMERRSGTLRVGPVINARVEMREGRVVNAVLDGAEELPVRERIFRILDATEGRFEFIQGEVELDGSDQVALPTSNLILEHARRRDESAR
jgi:DNA-binding response OmpR family regulator